MDLTLSRHFSLIIVYSLLIACGDSVQSPALTSPPIANKTPASSEKIVLLCRDSCTEVSKQIARMGGKITHSFENVQALAATVPSSAIETLEKNVHVKAIDKDVVTKTPEPIEPYTISSTNGFYLQSIPPLTLKHLVEKNPPNFSYNNLQTGAALLHQKQQLGDNIIVAVVDTGTANNSDVVPSLAGAVIGGESFVDEPNEPSATSTQNAAHGTSVGSMIAGHGAMVLPEESPLLQSLRVHAPESVLSGPNNEAIVPLLGTAPAAKIYAMKVFGVADEGSPRSRTVAAMDRIVTLKRNFNAGMPAQPISGDGTENSPFIYDSLDIQVANFSLGGPTLFAGQEIEDVLTLEMLKVGVTVVAAVGNEGFAAITGASPGTGLGALSVGAASSPVNERVLRDLQLGLGQGILFRPTNYFQVADFSSRGPTADGRIDPELVANGIATLVQRADGKVGLVSGTSLSAPLVAGAAALLRQAMPTATANQVRLALINGANPKLISNATRIDQGHGLIDIPAALALLENNSIEDDLPRLPVAADPPVSVATILDDNGFNIIDMSETGDYFQTVLVHPGQTVHFFVKASKSTEQIIASITGINPRLTPAQQNSLFGDDVIFTVIDAPTSFDDTQVFEFLSEDTSFNIKEPQEGILRMAIMGDWTNAGAVSATINLKSEESLNQDPITFQGDLADDETDEFNFTVSPGTAQLEFALAWQYDWLFYPTHDLDLILVDPSGNMVLDGATLDSPERVSIANPPAGVWSLLVDGFLLHGLKDKYTVTMEQAKVSGAYRVAEPLQSTTSAAPLEKRLLHLNRLR